MMETKYVQSKNNLSFDSSPKFLLWILVRLSHMADAESPVPLSYDCS